MPLQTEFREALILALLFLPAFVAWSAQVQNLPPNPVFFAGTDVLQKSAHRLGKLLIGDDGLVYACVEKDLFAFESYGSIAWKIPLNYSCNRDIAPVDGGLRKIYLVAESRVLQINSLNNGTSEAAIEEIFSPDSGAEGPVEIIGLAVSVSSSTVLISVKSRGLFAYRMHGQYLWSAGPVLYQHGYQQGCRNNVTDCFFVSSPVIDQCEANVYISNSEGELYALSMRSPHFKWIQDLGSFDRAFVITPGNNGLLYVTVPAKDMLLALDVSTGNILWQGGIGPLSKEDYAPVVDSNGWISLGSLDGFIYTFSPAGVLKRFPKASSMDSVIQARPLLDCSGFAVYISQTEMDGKMSLRIGENTYISARKPKSVTFTLLVPATGTVYWSEKFPGKSLTNFSKSDLQHFTLDEEVLLAFVVASKFGNPLPCRSMRLKFALSCSRGRPKNMNIYAGDETAIWLFFVLESAILIALALLVRFCCIFWKKKKVQNLELAKFLEERRSLQLQKKALDRTISELGQKAAEEAVANEVLEILGDIVKQREGIERKLSTTYSLGRDAVGHRSKSLLPLYDHRRTRSFSFRGARKQSFSIFNTLSDTSGYSSSEEDDEDKDFLFPHNAEASFKGKEKASIEMQSSSEDDYEIYEEGDEVGFPGFEPSSSKGVVRAYSLQNLSSESDMRRNAENDGKGKMQSRSGSIRRRNLPSSN